MGRMSDAVRLLLMSAVFPLWVAAGLADWACHRASGIERTSGLRENLVHWLMFCQMGLGVLAVALLEVNAAVLLWVAALILLHELTVYLELRYTVARRQVRPIEQVVHSLMEMLPLVALALLAALRWDQVAALWGAGQADFGLRAKAQPLPGAYLLGAGAAAFVFNALPLAEETWRCLRASE